MRTKSFVALLVLLALALPASLAHAGGVVSVCDEAHLRAALAGRGTVTFSCSEPIVTDEILISADTTIDGSGQTVYIMSYAYFGRMFTVNSEVTLNLNDSLGGGGGAYNFYGGTLSMSNSTFSGNRAGTRGGGIYANGGALTLKNVIVANSATGSNCYRSITDGGGNLSYPDTTCPGINADPVLSPLQDNGGPTHTMALGPGSAAIDAANDATCAAWPVNNRDQRGFFRPWGPHCDIGAVERGPRQITWLPVARVRREASAGAPITTPTGHAGQRHRLHGGGPQHRAPHDL